MVGSETKKKSVAKSGPSTGKGGGRLLAFRAFLNAHYEEIESQGLGGKKYKHVLKQASNRWKKLSEVRCVRPSPLALCSVFDTIAPCTQVEKEKWVAADE